MLIQVPLVFQFSYFCDSIMDCRLYDLCDGGDDDEDDDYYFNDEYLNDLLRFFILFLIIQLQLLNLNQTLLLNFTYHSPKIQMTNNP